MMKPPTRFVALLLLLLPAVSLAKQCRLQSKDSSTQECRRPNNKLGQARLPVCVGVRGNGSRLFAHFPALARVVEALGPISAVAGGSSASVTSFLVESIESNPLVVHCPNDTCCSVEEQIARISFLFKSVQAIPDESSLAVEASLGPLLQDILDAEILERLQSDNTAEQLHAVADLLIILQSQDEQVAALINPDVVALLQNSPDPVYHATDILSNADPSSFAINGDPLVFIRPYLLNFPEALKIIDLVASFYAGLDPVNQGAMADLLDDCAFKSTGKKWLADIESMTTRSGSTCGVEFGALYRDFLDQRDASHPTRLEDTIGDKLPTMVHTSIVQGTGYEIWQQALKDYEEVNYDYANNETVSFDVNFEDARFGYFGDKFSLQRASTQLPKLFDDEKSSRFISLGSKPWSFVLARSTAEPTLSRGVPLPDIGSVSFGGWCDPVPAQVLTSIGCDKIVLINRPDGIGSFSVDIPVLLGATQEIVDDLYKLEDPESSFAKALTTADATICADWDTPDAEPALLAETGYVGPFLSNDACVLSLNVGADNDKKIIGCTPE